MKEFIKNIPIIGPATKIAWTLLHINSFIQALQHQQDQIDELRDVTMTIAASTQKIQQLETELAASTQKIQQLQDGLASAVEQQLFHQALAMQQRIDQFIFDARQTLLRHDIDDQEKMAAVLAQASQLQEKRP